MGVPRAASPLLLSCVLFACAGIEREAEPRSATVKAELTSETHRPQFVTVGFGAFEQLFAPQGIELLSGVQVRSGQYVDAIRFRYRNPRTGQHRFTEWFGGSGGTDRGLFELSPGEKITRIDACSGTFLDSVKFTTNAQPPRTYGPHGGSGGFCASVRTRSLTGLNGATEVKGFCEFQKI